MPPRIVSVPRPWKHTQRLSIAPNLPASCSLWRICRGQLLGSCRTAATLSSATTVNARPDIPSSNEAIYDALDNLKHFAPNYVNVERLQLALRGLEAREAPVRLAILGLGGQIGGRKLARLLLADPLAAEAQWERVLEGSNDEDVKPLLLRYGEDPRVEDQDPTLDRVFVPSRFLRKNGLEILVSNFQVSPFGASISQDSILNPHLESTDSATSTAKDVSYPVHKTILFGAGIRSCVAYGRATAQSVAEDVAPEMIRIAVGLPAPNDDVHVAEPGYSLIDMDTASDALARFRESIANSAYFEHGWFRSGLPALSQWMVEGLEQKGNGVKPPTRTLILSILDSAESKLTKEDSKRIEELVAATVSENRRQSILGSVQFWAESAHTELRNQLDLAFAGRNWHKIAWWKLFWRVDDVGMITSEILERRWLVEAEKGSVYVIGRIQEAGLSDGVQEIHPETQRADSASSLAESSISSPVRDAEPELGVETVAEQAALRQAYTGRIPSQITLVRDVLLKETVAPLHALAQKLVLLTLSTTSITSTLSALLYISMPTFSLFEAGAVAAVGLVFSLKNMQKKWETAREVWQSEIREEGRKVLKHTEDTLRLTVKSGGRAQPDAESIEERANARTAIKKAREVLNELKS